MFKVSVEKFWPGEASSKPKKSAKTANKSIDYKVGYRVKYEWIDSYSTKQITKVDFYVCDSTGSAGDWSRAACFSVLREAKWPRKTLLQDAGQPGDVASRIEEDKKFIEGCKYEDLLAGGPKGMDADPFVIRMLVYADELNKLNGGLHSVAASKVI